MSTKIKLTYIIGLNHRWVAFEWIAQNIDHAKFDLDFILLNEKKPPLAAFLEKINIPYKLIPYQHFTDNPATIHAIVQHLKANKTAIVHTHFAGDIHGLTAAVEANIPVRIHTRHHAGRSQWLSKHWVITRDPEKLALSTKVIAINQKAKQRLLAEGIHEDKIAVVYHGFNLSDFKNIGSDRIENLRLKYQIQQKSPIIGVVSRYIEIKGIEYTIRAYKKVLQKHPNALLILAGAYGPYAKEIKQTLTELPQNSYLEIHFEEDLFALFQLFDIFVHVPITPDVEAYGQVYVEAMLSKIPSVITVSGLAHDYAEHKKNCWVVDYKNSEQIKEGILELLENHSLRQTIIQNAQTCAKQYNLKRMITDLEELYKNTLKLFKNVIV